VAVFGFPARLGMFVAGLGKKGNPEGYMMACEKFLTKDPKNRGVNLALGDAAAAAGHVQAAIFAYETAAEHHAADTGVLKKLGNLLWKAGEIRKAHEVFDRAVKLDPHDQDAVKARKNLAAEASLKETGFETARSSRDLVKDKGALGKIEQDARLHRTDEDLESTKRDVEERLAKGETPELLLELAQALKKLKQWDEALAAADRAIAKEPQNLQFRFAKGDLEIERLEEGRLDLLRDGKKEEAKRTAQELLKVRTVHLRERVKAYPTDLNLRFKLGDLLFDQGQVDAAITEFQQTVRDPKFRSESHLRLGRSFKVKGQHDLALRQLEQAMDGQSGMSERVKEILYERGDTLERMGRPADAKVEFGRIYEFDIGFRDVGERLRKLEGGESRSTLSLEN
ncbi:MAG TPA: tetratricopeptide repeat protein, partial [Planctomycetota bacterium]|nr:tetratricopeptide repeat protein [Planctomycetota bacterium]